MAATTTPLPFFGWRVVWAAFTLAVFGWGIGFYGPPIFLHEVVARTGWSVPFVSSAITLHFLVGAVVVANLAALYGRFGVPAVTVAAAVFLALGILGWAYADAPWQLLAAAVLSGVGWVGLGAAALNAIVAPWFVRTRTKALSMAYNGSSIGGVIMSPLWVTLIAWYGFGAATALIGGVMLAVVCLLAWKVLTKSPQRLGQLPDGDAGDGGNGATVAASTVEARPGSALWRNRTFTTLAAAMALGLFAQIGLLAHLYSILVPPLGAQGAGLAMALATAVAIAGRMLVAHMIGAHTDRRLAACASYLVQVTGSIVLIVSAGENAVLLLLGVVLFGSGIGNATSLSPLIAQVEFAEADVQRAVSLMVACAQTTYAFAPAAFGLARVFDPGGISWLPAGAAGVFVLAAAAQVLAIICMLAGRRPGAR